jgi:hypothetical protein
LFGSEYLNAPVSPLYVFGRHQDVALQKRATPSANAMVYGCGWHRSRLTDWERVSPQQSPRLQRFNSIDPNADSIMVAFPTGTFLDAA